jgi:hypothetical protein
MRKWWHWSEEFLLLTTKFTNIMTVFIIVTLLTNGEICPHKMIAAAAFRASPPTLQLYNCLVLSFFT